MCGGHCVGAVNCDCPAANRPGRAGNSPTTSYWLVVSCRAFQSTTTAAFNRVGTPTAARAGAFSKDLGDWSSPGGRLTAESFGGLVHRLLCRLHHICSRKLRALGVAMIIRTIPVVILLVVSPLNARAQDRLPVIDMHLHADAADANGPPPVGICTPFEQYPAWDPAQSYDSVFTAMLKNPPCRDPVWSPETDEELINQTIAVMQRRNIIGVLSGSPDRVAAWREAAPDLFIPAILFNPIHNPEITPDSLRRLVEMGKVAVLGEINTQYAGIAPGDDIMAPYWRLAEDLDIPVGIHMGAGPPGVAAFGRGYRARLSSARMLEDVLVRHPRLRVYIMHAGYPLLDDLLAVLFVHPQVHVDVSAIVRATPRRAFYRYLGGIVEAGFANRVMFGSDSMVWPGTIEQAIAVIEEAPLLSEEQKRDILYNNAARFLRFSDKTIASHHGR